MIQSRDLFGRQFVPQVNKQMSYQLTYFILPNVILLQIFSCYHIRYLNSCEVLKNTSDFFLNTQKIHLYNNVPPHCVITNEISWMAQSKDLSSVNSHATSALALKLAGCKLACLSAAGCKLALMSAEGCKLALMSAAGCKLAF